MGQELCQTQRYAQQSLPVSKSSQAPLMRPSDEWHLQSKTRSSGIPSSNRRKLPLFEGLLVGLSGLDGYRISSRPSSPRSREDNHQMPSDGISASCRPARSRESVLAGPTRRPGRAPSEALIPGSRMAMSEAMSEEVMRATETCGAGPQAFTAPGDCADKLPAYVKSNHVIFGIRDLAKRSSSKDRS